MSEFSFRTSSRICRPASEVFEWHQSPGAFQRLVPPWESVELISQPEGIANGSRVELRQRIGPFAITWLVEHRDCDGRRQFRDVQIRGPFSHWDHLHLTEAENPGSSVLTDEIHYGLPGGGLGRFFAGGFVQRKLRRTFNYRHSVMLADLELASRYGAVRKMKFLISGATGLVGRAMIPFLQSQGHHVVCLVRRRPVGEGEVFWNPAKGELNSAKLRGIDVVIHLAGERVAGRWSPAKRERIWASRVEGTRTLVTALSELKHRPFALVSASATGLYGDRDREELDEQSERGSGFLADVCDAWEREAMAATDLGIRVAVMRTGLVLTPDGGALGELLPLFRLGLGGRLGNGRQWVSWISIDDLVGAYYHAVLDQRCSGPVNAVAPTPVSNAEFTHELAEVLSRPAVLPLPSWILRGVFGEMADETLLSSVRVTPRKLLQSSYGFRQERLGAALAHLLGREA